MAAPITEEVFGYDGANNYDFGQTMMSWAGLGSDARQAAYNEKMAQWQADRQDTSYQRAVADMKAAGLNPALMYGSGGAEGANVSANAGQSNGQGINQFLNGITNLLTTVLSKGKSATPVTKIEKHTHYNNIFK